MMAAAPLLTGCIEEVVPTSGIIQEQLEGSSKATEALVWAIPGHQNQVGTVSDEHWDWGLPALMHIRDLLTADMVCSNTNYRHFWYWTDISIGLGPDFLYPMFPWNWYYEQVLACNKVIAAVDSETTNPDLRFYLAQAMQAVPSHTSTLWACTRHGHAPNTPTAVITPTATMS